MRHLGIYSISIVLLAAIGCGASPSARFYTLSPTAKADEGSTASYTVGVGPVSIPSAVDRPQFVVQVAANRVEIDEFSQWVGPLDEIIAHAVAANLAVLLGTSDIAVTPLASLTPDYRVTIDVQRFESVRGEAVTIDAVWAVRGSTAKQVRSGHTLARESVSDGSVDALAAAHSSALAVVSADIAAALREIAAHKR